MVGEEDVSLYNDLGVPKSATLEEIRMAYRKKAQKAHPDKGGSESEFRQLQQAYDILSDPERKARYDQTGETHQGPTLESQALSYVAALLPKILDSVLDASRLPLIDKLKEAANADIARMKADKQQGERIVAKRREALKRLSPGILSAMIETEIGIIEAKIKSIDNQITVLNLAIKIISDHSYQSESSMGTQIMGWYVMGAQA